MLKKEWKRFLKKANLLHHFQLSGQLYVYRIVKFKLIKQKFINKRPALVQSGYHPSSKSH